MLVCAGDSITAHARAWPRLLPVEGHVVAAPGVTIAAVVEQVEREPAGDALVLTVGTNDVLRLGEPPDLAQVDRLAAAAARFPRVVWLDVLLFLPLHPPRYWRQLAVSRRQVRAAFRASFPALRPALGPTCWSRDGIHPNVRGQRRIAAAVEGWLR